MHIHRLIKGLHQPKIFLLEEIQRALYQAYRLEIRMGVIFPQVLLHTDLSTSEVNCDSEYDHQKIKFLKEQTILLRVSKQDKI